ncbi:MAG: acyltransferase [Oscillospiraceae bacterium]|nr:acyltransferase [Oscillospiraceae bacterium]
MYLILCYALVAVVILSILTTSEKVRGGVLDRQSTSVFQGICALLIVLHHIGNNLSVYHYFISAFGYLSCGVFFLISGYGNELSLKRNGRSTKWLGRKLSKLYIPFLVCYVLYFLSLVIFDSDSIPKFGDIIVDLLTMSNPGLVNWFPKVIFICFVIHWLLNRFIEKNTVIYYVLAFSAALVCIGAFYALDKSVWYYNSVLCYPIGMLLPQVKDKIKYGYGKCAVALLAFGGVFLFASGFIQTAQSYRAFFMIIACALFAIFCYLITGCRKFHSRLLEWLGHNSFEVFLFQTIFLNLFTPVIEYSSLLYAGLVLACTFALVFVYRKLYDLLSLKISSKNG